VWSGCSITVSRLNRIYDKPHCQANIQFRYWAIDSWDAGENALFYVDGAEKWRQDRVGQAASCAFGGFLRYLSHLKRTHHVTL
jgi:hypothetical protein